MATRRHELPAPTVRLAADFTTRLGALGRRLARSRGRRGGDAAGAGWARGSEFEGHRPYRPGDDVRELDWTLLARFPEPQIRLRRPEGAERWAIALDASGSMGLGGERGEHGKLQCAAEVALGLASIGLASGAEVRLVARGAAPRTGADPARDRGGSESAERDLRLRRAQDVGLALAWAAGLRAGGDGLSELLARAAWGRGVERLLLVGDLFDVRPAEVAALVRPGLDVGVVRVLAPEELAPPSEERVAWLDAEGDGRRTVDLARAAGAYQRALQSELEAWERVAVRGRLGLCVARSDAPFERAVLQLLGHGS